MHILVHDYSGHPFQVQLSRALADRGHQVTHLYSASFQTPKGPLQPRPDDPPNFAARGLSLRRPFSKHRYLVRLRQELEYGGYLRQEVARLRPDVVLSSNTPLNPQATFLRATRRRRARFVFWLQDIYSTAITSHMRRTVPIVGTEIGRYYRRLERSLLQRSDAVVAITEDFSTILDSWGIERTRQHVVHNWAPLEDLPVHPKRNAWARSQGIESTFNFVYSGTLGLKHNPDLLLQLALRFRNDPRVRVVVVSEGLGASWLEERKEQEGLDNLLLLGFQPFEILPQILASADALLAILEPDAGVFSVPSKVLTYLCAQRPLLLAVPPQNLAARLVTDHRAGLTVPPDDVPSLLNAAERLLSDPEVRNRLGFNARAYAEKRFDIDRLARRFERILTG